MLYDEERATTEQMRRGIREEGEIADRYQAAFPEERLETTGLWLMTRHCHGCLRAPIGSRRMPWSRSNAFEVDGDAPGQLQNPNAPPDEGHRAADCDIVQWDGKELQVDRVYYDRETMEDLIEMLEPVAEAVKQGRADPENVPSRPEMRDRRRRGSHCARSVCAPRRAHFPIIVI